MRPTTRSDVPLGADSAKDPQGSISRPYLRLAVCALLLPIALIALLGALSIYLPLDQADKITLPILLFPLLYVGGIFLVFLSDRLARIALTAAALTALNAVGIFLHFSGSAT